MSTLMYQELSRDERRKARKLAGELLQSVPAAAPLNFDNPDSPMAMPFMRPRNVVAAFLHSKGKSKWRGEVAFRKGKTIVQVTTLETTTSEDALALVKRLIASTKAMARWINKQENTRYTESKVAKLHVQEDGEQLAAIAIRHKNIPRFARHYANNCPDILGGYLVDKCAYAKNIVLKDKADNGRPPFIKCAAAFLLSNGVSIVDYSDPRPEFFWAEIARPKGADSLF